MRNPAAGDLSGKEHATDDPVAVSEDTGRFGRNRRIRKSADFAAVLKSGRRGSTPHLSMAVAATSGAARLGISAPSKIGGSVQRNRARRLVREHYRRTHRVSAPYDIVVNLKAGFAELSAREVRNALDEAFARAIAHGKGSGRRVHSVH